MCILLRNGWINSVNYIHYFCGFIAWSNPSLILLLHYRKWTEFTSTLGQKAGDSSSWPQMKHQNHLIVREKSNSLKVFFLNFMNIKSRTQKFLLWKQSLMLIAQMIKYSSDQSDSVLSIKPCSTQLLSAVSGEKYDVREYSLSSNHKYYTEWEKWEAAP